MKFLEKFNLFYSSDTFWAGLFRDLVFFVAVITVLASISRIALGLWMPAVAVESGSMAPHIQIGDIILIDGTNRNIIQTYDNGKQSGYKSFDEYGDVILYRPFGRDGVTPIIHRAMYYVDKGDPLWNEGPPAPHAGYITKGDNNTSYDQKGSISYLQPVKKEWVIGAARFARIPLMGCVPLFQRGNFACLEG